MRGRVIFLTIFMKKNNMNGYIKLFLELSKLKPNQMVDKMVAEKFGFFMTDLDLLHEEKYIFRERVTKIIDKEKNLKKNSYDIKLAPRGFKSLEEYMKNMREKEKDKLLRDSAIVLTLATTTGILFQVWDKFKELFYRIQEVPLLVSGIFWLIILTFGSLFIFKTINR